MQAQSLYTGENIEVLNHLTGGSAPTTTNPIKYKACTGWHQAATGREYVIYNFESKLYFTDITNPKIPVNVDSVSFGYPQKIEVSGNYCYVFFSELEIARYDLRYLPDSVSNTNWYFFDWTNNLLNRFEKNKMYQKRPSDIVVFSLKEFTPPNSGDTLKKFIKHLGAITRINVKDNFIYASSYSNGLYIIKYDSINHSFSLTDSLFHNFPNIIKNYNNCINQNSTVICTVYDPTTIEANFYVKQNNGKYKLEKSNQLMPSTYSITPQFVSNDWLLASNIQDGLFVYDVSDLNNIKKTGFFNTRSAETNTNNTGIESYYSGLPSGNILALDKKNGIFILDAKKAMPSKIPTVIEPILSYELSTFPNPCNEGFTVQLKRDHPSSLSIITDLGVQIYQTEYSSNINDFISTKDLLEGNYILKIEGNEGQLTQKIIVKH